MKKLSIEDREFRLGKQWSSEQEEKLKSRGQAPIVVNRVNIVSMYAAVDSPGLIPGIKPPYFLKLSAVSVGLKVIEV